MPTKSKSSKKKFKKRSKGVFITFEGGEGSGKSSQIKLLEKNLKKSGYRTILTREPGGSAGAEAVRHVLLSGAAKKFGPQTEAMLFSAARADHVAEVIVPGLEAGKIVLCDRFYDSTRVYQGVEGNVDETLVLKLEQIAVGDTRPDLTLMLDLDPKIGMERIKARLGEGEALDRFEQDSLARQKKRRKGYLGIAKAEPERCKVIDASKSEEEIEKTIWQIVLKKLEELGVSAK